MRVKIDEEDFAGAVAQDLLWNAEHAYDPDIKKAARKMAFYYMTFDEVAQYLGSREEAEEYFQ